MRSKIPHATPYVAEGESYITFDGQSEKQLKVRESSVVTRDVTQTGQVVECGRLVKKSFLRFRKHSRLGRTAVLEGRAQCLLQTCGREPDLA